MRNSQLTIHHGNHLEPLLNRLGDVLAREPLPAMKREVIVVQSQGMRRWLTLGLTKKFTIVASLDLPFPRLFCRSMCSHILGLDDPRSMQRDALVWRIFSLLGDKGELASIRDGGALEHFLKADPYGRKRFQFAYRLAGLFDDYQLYRHEMIERWIDDQPSGSQALPHEIWQADIFRYLYRRSEGRCLSQQIQRSIALLSIEAVPLPNERLSVFGVTTLPPRFIDLLVALSWRIPVDIYFVNPRRGFWADLPTTLRRRRRTGDAIANEDEDECSDKADSLLTSFGNQAQEFFTLLLQADVSGNAWDEVALDKEAPADSDALLHLVQRDVLALELRSEQKVGIRSDDRSISIHCCHSPIREMEVLKDQLLDAFHAMKDLRPQDIVVMVPDIAVYAPYIQAVFGVASDGGPALPFSIADRADRFASPIALIPELLLKLVRSRTSVSEVLDLLSIESVSRKFLIGEDDLSAIRSLIDRAGIRWGRDAAHRAQFDLPQVGHATWRRGLDRLLLGYAMGSVYSADACLLPAADATNASADLLSRLVTFFETLQDLLHSMSEPRTLAAWAQLLSDALSAMVAPRGEEEGSALTALHRACDALRLYHELVEADGRGPTNAEAAVIAEYFADVFAQDGFGRGFIDGRITFCALKPMRSIPFRVVALCGMNQNAYPRSTEDLAFDLITQHPTLGDRNVRKDDRYLFLESILAAEQRLIITYIGQDAKTNVAIPPSVCVSEFLDYLDNRFLNGEQGPIRRLIKIKHPLHAYSRRYFAGDSDLFTYSLSAYRAACAAQRKDSHVYEFVPTPLAVIDNSTTIQLEEMIRFWLNPSDYFCRRRLEIHLREEQDRDMDAEAFALDPLDRFRFGTEAIQHYLEGDADQNRTRDRLQLEQSARLPVDRLGSHVIARLSDRIDEFIARVHERVPEIGSAKIESVEIETLIDQTPVRVVGTVKGVLPLRLVQYRFANLKAKDEIRAWISHVFFSVAAPCGRQAELIGTDGDARWSALDDPQNILRVLIDGYRSGQRRPLPFFEYSSKRYAEWWHRHGDLPEAQRHERALLAVADLWRTNPVDQQRSRNWSKSDLEDPAVYLCFGDADPIKNDPETFSRWSLAFWSPYMAARDRSRKPPLGG
ncbi:MAG: exodeoxyribonuclease V subunit gamma [Deltaproteobacteria bacterium]|nr:exodeoxyribonuclease V subunit gamma [Deltaproteobacteria bacterium]